MSAESKNSKHKNPPSLIKTIEPNFIDQLFQSITGSENKLKTPLYKKLKALGVRTHIAHQEVLIIKVSKVKKFLKSIGRLNEFKDKVGKDKFLIYRPDFIVHSANLIIEVNGSAHEMQHKQSEDLFRMLVYRALAIEVFTVENHQLENPESLSSKVEQIVQLIKARKCLANIDKIRNRTRKYLSISRDEFSRSRNPKYRRLITKPYRFSEGSKQPYPTLPELKCRVLYHGYRTII